MIKARREKYDTSLYPIAGELEGTTTQLLRGRGGPDHDQI